MQTILGANGPIAVGLARELREMGVSDLRLVSRRPRAVHEGDELLAADLLDADATNRAVAGSETAYLTVGLPADSARWEAQFPVMMRHVIDACAAHGTRLVFFDNTYMYPGTPATLTEATPFAPNGRKGRVRARITTMLQDAMDAHRIDAMVCRAPEFYGPGRTTSFTNALIFARIRAGKPPLIPLSARTVRSLIWTPDASRALALLGATPDAYGRTWHLPVDPHRLTYAQMIDVAQEVTGRRIHGIVLPRAAFSAGGRVSPLLREMRELLPRYAVDNVFDSSAFTTRFPDFRITPYAEGIARILQE